VKERLQKFLASAGVASRRKAEQLITAGRVRTNGQVVTKLGTTIDPEHDRIEVDGQSVQAHTAHRYVALNKPVGVVCSTVAQGGERTVYHLVPNSRGLAIAGRLDKDSDGLVLLTDDGELVNKLTHPRYQHAKEYLVETIKPLDQDALNKLRRGIKLAEGQARVNTIEPRRTNHYHLVLHQGWKRQIRRMIGAVRNDVVRLQRVRIAKLNLAGLKPGQWREVARADII
jgi:pseudouridine synthase